MENIRTENLTTHSAKEGAIHIVVVDDHPNTASTLARAIAQLGGNIETLPVVSGKQALEFADTAAIDILITDMMMPDMNGLELIEQLQAHPGGRPAYIILITAYGIPGLKETARRLKVNEVLIKPIPPQQICQIIEQALGAMGYPQLSKPVAQSRTPAKILIADDYPDNISLLSRYLASEGYEFISAHDGVETLEKARTEMPDLILMDVNMPRKDGLRALEELRADPTIEHIPVIVLTAARISPADMQHGLNLGADDYVIKPFDRLELLARIRTKLRVKNAEDLIRQRNRELNILPEIGRELSARLDLEELSNLVLRRTVETLGAMMGHILILNSKYPLHKHYRISTTGSNEFEIPFPPLNLLLQQVEENRASILIKDVLADPRWPTIPGDPTRSAVIVPMFGRLNLIGLFVLVHEQPDYFSQDHHVLLQAIASQASIAVENAKLYADMAREQQRSAAILHSAADAIMMFDADGILSMLNPAAEKLFTDYQTKLGLPLARDSGYDMLINCLEEAYNSDRPYSRDVVWPDQRVFIGQFTPIPDGGCVVVLHDVTHFKKLEKVKDEFIATASHDLRNPITSIKGFSQLIQQAGPLNEIQEEFIQRIQHAADNMNDLVGNMLDLAKMDLGAEPRREILDVAHLLAQIVAEFQPQAEAKGQLLALKETETHSSVKGDAFQLRQAIKNLVGNAIKYTPAGGTVTLSSRNLAGVVRINIQDTGYGMPASDLPHVFERFYRVRNNGHDEIEGNGLGLAIVKSIAEGHRGNVTVESEPGKGSAFTLTLPLVNGK